MPYNTGFVSVVDAEGRPVYSVTERRGGGALLGLDASLRVAGPLAVVVGGSYGPAGISSYYVDRDPGFRDTADFRVRFTGETIFARAGLSLRLQGSSEAGEARLRPATDLFAGAGMVRQLGGNHPAANFGFRGAFPLARRGMEFTVGLEDYLVFWDEETLAPRMADLLRPSEEPVGAELLYDTSSVLLVRAGFSFRF